MSKKSIMALFLAVGLATTSIPVSAVSGNDVAVYEDSISDESAVSDNYTVTDGDAGFAMSDGNISVGQSSVVITEVKTCSNAGEIANTIDKDTETFWTSKDKHTPENRHVWECTFDKTYNLKEVCMVLGRKASNGSWGFVPDNFRIELLKDGMYEMVEDYTEVSSEMTVNLPANTSADGVRLSFLDTKAKGFSIREVSFVEEQKEEEKEQTITPNTEKKVYADYHGPRYTRELDGNIGNWGYVGQAESTATEQGYVVRNADMLMEDGKRQLAVGAYPMTGMQSQMNQDYQEYQILLAKMANIDGFFVEWGYPGHGTHTQLELMKEVAEKYDFELGVNWCDAWHLKNWITSIKPDVITREQKVQEAVNSLGTILDTLYASPVGALYNGHPLVYIFGGFEKDELKKITSEAVIPEKFAEKEPWYFRRASISGRINAEGKAEFSYAGESWHDVIQGPFGWVPERLRDAIKDGISGFDKYATKEDVFAYMETLKKTQTTDSSIPVRNSVVTPGMDNRPCAGWGSNFRYLDREDGELYKAIWEYNVANRDYLDVVYIATWNDFTEGTQIEPTVEDGYRELLTTQKYAYEFKGEGTLDDSGIHLPGQLLELRTETRRLEKIGFKTDAQQEILDKAGMAISDGRYEDAVSYLKEAETQLKMYKITEETITCGKDGDRYSVEFGEAPAPLPEMYNVALNKPVKANAQLNKASGPELAVDGNYALDSRWRTPTDIDEHWLEIDLEGEYEICGAGLFMGDGSGWPINNFCLEYWKNGQWNLIPGTSFTDNEVRDLTLTFDPIITTKVRFYSNEKIGRGVRLKEIELYSLSKEIPEDKPVETPEEEGWNVENGCYLTFDDDVIECLQNIWYTGKIQFTYLDEGKGKVIVNAATHDETPFGDYSIVASINKTDTGKWLNATVELEGTHIVMNHEAENKSDLVFSGDGRVKDVSVEFTTYKASESIEETAVSQ